MNDRRHRAFGHSSQGGLVVSRRGAPAPVFLAGTGGTTQGVFHSDHVGGQAGSRLKWLISTCLAGLVGVCAIALAIYGSMENPESDGMLASLERLGRDAMKPRRNFRKDARALRVAAKKTDLLQTTADGLTAKSTIHESIRQRRNGREFIEIKRYTRIVAQLATAPPQDDDLIPQFNPYKLYADTKPIGSKHIGANNTAGADNISVKVLELVGGILPREDGQELTETEVASLIAKTGEEYDGPYASGTGPALVPGAPDGAELLSPVSIPDHTTDLVKTVFEPQQDDPIDGQETRIIRVGKGDSLTRLLVGAGIENWQAKLVAEASRPVLAKTSLRPGEELHLALAPSPTRPGGMDPLQITLFGNGHQHRFSVVRDETGRFVLRDHPVLRLLGHSDGTMPTQRTTLYKSIYQAGLSQKLPPDTINQILRIHLYDTDYKRRVSPGDSIELFFDREDERAGATTRPGELLFTSITVAGESRRFYRFRTPDGVVDFYDVKGNNSKKFLMRKPVKGVGVRLSSVFGYRKHPVLGRRRMHLGIDWATKSGTPILAAGAGVVEEAGRKGGYGNYARIRHANSYKTAYAHMQRLAKGLKKGVKVRQGQVIGYVGSTGLSSGPHLHFEVLVDNRHVDPLKIHVPRERQLRGKMLVRFQKERARIDDLMRRPPVTTRFAQVNAR